MTDTTTVARGQSRRRFLKALATGGAVLLAGCGDSGSGTPTGNSGGNSSHLVDQTFRVPVEHNPDRVSYYAPWSGDDLEATYAVTPKKKVEGRMHHMVREPGVWADQRYSGSELHYTWVKDITISPTEVRVRISDDASWSDGTPITGRDISLGLMDLFLRTAFPPYFATESEGRPSLYWNAIDGFDISDKTVTYQSSPGYFDLFWKRWYADFGDGAIPTHIEPYSAYADAVFETARRAIRGEIDPWTGWKDPRTRPDDPYTNALREKYLAKEGKYVAKFAKPEHVLSTSAWDLVEINGPEAVFEPNPHHRHTDQLNYEQVVLEYAASEKRSRAALSADRLDYAAPGPTPQSAVEALPEHITQLQIPGGEGNELGLDLSHPALGNREVRLALMYALDQPTIAKNIHQSTAIPVTIPGGESWNVTDYVSEAWIDENLTTYPQDRAKAAELMQDAGFTREGGQWVTAEEKPLTFELPTTSETPRWAPTVASQLGEFGIEMSVKPMRDEAFETQHDNGQFSLWAASGTATGNAASALFYWFSAAVNPKVVGVYPKEAYRTGDFSQAGHPVPLTQKRYDVFTIEAPPIGQPDGPLQEYHPSALSLAFFRNPSDAEFERRVKTALWLVNWILPVIPINKTVTQHFIDDSHWRWPTDTNSWQVFTNGGPRSIDPILASGTIQANPDNPEQA